MNKYLCVGRLGNDPELIEQGCKLRIVTQTKESLWLSVFVFGQAAENCIKYKKKGELVSIVGRLEQSKSGSLVVVSHDVGFL